MRKIYLILLLSISLLGATGFFVNGDSVTTISVGDYITIEGILEGGDSLAYLTVYYDLKNNGVLDINDPIVDYHYIIDGSWADDDETINDTLSFEGPFFPIVSDFICVAEDAGGNDQTIIHVQSPASSLSLNGHIEPDTAGIIVQAVPLPADLNTDPGIISTLTDSNGNYSVGIPDSFSGNYFKILTITHEDVLPDYLGVLSKDSVMLTGNDTINDSLIQTDVSLLRGNFLDEDGFPYLYPIGTEIIGKFGDISGSHTCRKIVFAFGGTGNTFLHTSPSGQAGNGWLLDLKQNASPYYMCPEMEDTIRFDYPPDTLMDDFTVFSCDAAIAGSVFVDGNPIDGEEVWAWSDSTGSAPTSGTFSTGYYKMLVSSQADSYRVGLSSYDWTMYGGDKIVAPGSTGVNFYVNTSGIKDNEVYRILKSSTSLITASTTLEITGVNKKNCKLKIYNVTGELVETIPQKSLSGTTAKYALNIENLSAGIFFGKIEGQIGTIKLSVIK